jgi:hypothetical protein
MGCSRNDTRQCVVTRRNSLHCSNTARTARMRATNGDQGGGRNSPSTTAIRRDLPEARRWDGDLLHSSKRHSDSAERHSSVIVACNDPPIPAPGLC